jgi:hypothetical protein
LILTSQIVVERISAQLAPALVIPKQPIGKDQNMDMPTLPYFSTAAGFLASSARTFPTN